MTEKLIKGKSDAAKGILKQKSIPSSMSTKAEILSIFKRASLYDIIWYSSIIALCGVAIALAYSKWMTYLSVLEMFCGLLAANLIARGKIAGIWLNIVDCIMYGVIAYMSHAYGELIKVLIISNIFNVYGIINWSKSSKKTASTNEFDVRILSKKMSLIVYPAFIAMCVAMYFILNAFGTNKAYFGCITFSGNIMIKYLQMSRYREAWYFAIFGDFIALLMWTMILVDNVTANGDWSVLPTAAACLGYFVNAINGLIVWNKLYKVYNISGSVYLAMRPVKITRFIRLKRNMSHLVWSAQKDHVPTEQEIAVSRKMRVAFKRGMFSGS